MKTIQEVNGKPLLYVPDKVFSSNSELRLGPDGFAILQGKKLFNFLNKATAQSGDGEWVFRQKGWFSRHITVRESHSNSQVALFEVSRGLLELEDGRKFYWQGKPRLPIQWEGGLNFRFDEGPSLVNFEGRWLDERGQDILRIMKRTVLTKESLSLGKIKFMDSEDEMQIDILPAASDAEKELSLLALFSWYLLVYE